MVGLTLVSELIFEAVKFVVMLGLLVLAVFAGGKIRKGLDAKKAAISPTTLGRAKPLKIKLKIILINAIITPGTAPKMNIPIVIITSEKSNFKKPIPGIIGNSNFITTKAIQPINA